jgi:hypothetical protein
VRQDALERDALAKAMRSNPLGFEDLGHAAHAQAVQKVVAA